MENTKQNTFTLTMTQLSGAMSLPVLLAGYFVGLNGSLLTGVMQIAFVNIMLCIAACTYVQVATQHKTITVVIAKHFFGKQGAMICGAGMLAIMVGWAIIQLHYILAAMQVVFAVNSTYMRMIFALLISLSFYFVMANGLKSFHKINRMIFPLLIVIFIISLFGTKNNPDVVFSGGASIISGSIIILTASSGMLYDLPTYYRFATTLKSARASLMILFLFVIPMVQLLGLILSKYHAMSSFADFNMAKLLMTFSKTGLCVLIMSSFLINCLNIYSSTLIVSQFVRYSYKQILIVICLLCTASGYFVIGDSLIPILELMNVIAEIMLCLILVYVIFYGADLGKVSARQTYAHSILLYAALVGAVLLHYLPFSFTNDYFINATLLAITFMTINMLARKYR